MAKSLIVSDQYTSKFWCYWVIRFSFPFNGQWLFPYLLASFKWELTALLHVSFLFSRLWCVAIKLPLSRSRSNYFAVKPSHLTVNTAHCGWTWVVGSLPVPECELGKCEIIVPINEKVLLHCKYCWQCFVIKYSYYLVSFEHFCEIKMPTLCSVCCRLFV